MSRRAISTSSTLSTTPGLVQGNAYFNSPTYGELVAVANIANALLVSVADRKNPRVLSSYTPTVGASDANSNAQALDVQVDVSSQTFHFAWRSFGYVVANVITDPTTGLTRLATVARYNPSPLIFVNSMLINRRDNVTWIACSDGIRSIDISGLSNLANLTLSSRNWYPISPDATRALIFSNGILYAAAETKGMVSVNASYPYALSSIGMPANFPVTGLAAAIAMQDNIVYLSSNGEIAAVDVSNSAAPVRAGSQSISSSRRVAFAGQTNNLFACDDATGVNGFAVSITTSGTTRTVQFDRIGKLATNGNCRGLTINGLDLFTGGGATFFIASIPSIKPVQIGNPLVGTKVYAGTTSGTKLLLSRYDGIDRVEMGNPNTPVTEISTDAGVVPYDSNASDIAVGDDGLIYRAGNVKLQVFASQQSTFQLVAELALSGRAVASAWGYCYVLTPSAPAPNPNKLAVIDLSGRVGTALPNPNFISNGLIQSQRIKINRLNGRIYMTDVSGKNLISYNPNLTVNGSEPFLEWTIPLANVGSVGASGTYGLDLYPEGAVAAVAGGNGGLYLIDLITQSVKNCLTGGLAYDVAFYNNGGMVAVVNSQGTNSNNQVILVDISGLVPYPSASFIPQSTGSINLQRVMVSNGCLVATAIDAGYFIASPTVQPQTPNLAKNGFRLSPQQTKPFTKMDLNITATGTSDSALTFTPSTSNGYFQSSNAPGQGLVTVRYSDMADSPEAVDALVAAGTPYVQTVSTGGKFAATFFLNDGLSDTPASGIPYSLAVTFPTSQLVFQMTPVSVPQGARVQVPPSQFKVLSEGVADPDITVYFSSVVAGRYESSDAPGVAINKMSQRDIQAGKLYIVQDGSETPFDADVYAEIGALTSGAVQAAALNYIDVQGAPVAVVPPRIEELVEDKPYQLTSANVQYSKPVNPANPGGPLSITFGSINTANCRFTKDGTALASTTASFSTPQTGMNVTVTNVGKQVCTFTVAGSYVNTAGQTQSSAPQAMAVGTYVPVHKAPTGTVVMTGCPTDDKQTLTEAQFALASDGTNPTSGMLVRYNGTDFDLYNAGISLFNETFLYQLVQLGLIQYSCGSHPTGNLMITDAELNARIAADFNMRSIAASGTVGGDDLKTTIKNGLIAGAVVFVVFTIGAGGLWWRARAAFDGRLTATLALRAKAAVTPPLSLYYRDIVIPTIEHFFDNVSTNNSCCETDSTVAFMEAIEAILARFNEMADDPSFSAHDSVTLQELVARKNLKEDGKNKQKKEEAEIAIKGIINQMTLRIQKQFDLAKECFSCRGCCCGKLKIEDLKNPGNINAIASAVFNEVFPRMHFGLVQQGGDEKQAGDAKQPGSAGAAGTGIEMPTLRKHRSLPRSPSVKAASAGSASKWVTRELFDQTVEGIRDALGGAGIKLGIFAKKDSPTSATKLKSGSNSHSSSDSNGVVAADDKSKDHSPQFFAAAPPPPPPPPVDEAGSPAASAAGAASPSAVVVIDEPTPTSPTPLLGGSQV